MRVIYLDQNKWIRLLQQRKDQVPPHEEKIPEVLNLVQHTSDNREAIYPIDWTRLQETAVRSSEESRRELFDFMWEISDAWCFPTYNIVEHEEVTAAIERRIGIDPQLTSRILNKGVAHIAGGQNLVIENDEGESFFEVMSDEDIEELLGFFESDHAFKLATENEMINTLQDIYESDDQARLLSDWEASFENEYNDVEQRRRASHLHRFVHGIGKKYWKEGEKAGLTLTDLAIDLGDYVKRGEDAEKAESFLMEFSSWFAFNELRYQRDLSGETFTGNDLRDLMALAVAIPWSHVVVCEKHFANLAYQTNLDERFGTSIKTDLTDLHNEIP